MQDSKLQKLFPLLVLVLGLCTALPVSADTWRNYLSDGSLVQVDPYSYRARVTSPGGTSGPLWDGVHQLRDGSIITVRSGIVVPNRAIVEMRDARPQAPGPLQSRVDPIDCEKLQLKACGEHQECASTEACDLARQLLAMMQPEQPLSPARQYHLDWQTVRQCRQALTDEQYFPNCQPRIGKPSACARLVSKVCGADDHCSAKEACGVAQQLLGQEREERLASPDSDVATGSTGQCTQALYAADFFVACH